jgi:hypothetical protein
VKWSRFRNRCGAIEHACARGAAGDAPDRGAAINQTMTFITQAMTFITPSRRSSQTLN